MQLPGDGELLNDVELPGDSELLNNIELPGDIENLLTNTKEDLRKATEKIVMLQECLKSANETKEASNAKYKEADNYRNLKREIVFNATKLSSFKYCFEDSK